MNILFFLTPKSDVAFIYSDANLRETIDLMEAHRYSALPILTKQGRYAGTLTEGDLLWYMKSHLNQSLKDMELISVMEVKRRQDNSPVNAGAKMEDLLVRRCSRTSSRYSMTINPLSELSRDVIS